MDPHQLVRALADRHYDIKVDRHRENITVVVVGMLPNEINPARRPHNSQPVRIPEHLGKGLLDNGNFSPHYYPSLSKLATSAKLWGPTARSSAAFSSARVSLIKLPAPASHPAKN